ncbi:response regulator [Janibacter sp. GXQ6167]|uniref:response regulator transcription factor n=1 Tax=Janibacter sp. GXQ6167 TaxID=3240791 RepID=UPI0035246331
MPASLAPAPIAVDTAPRMVPHEGAWRVAAVDDHPLLVEGIASVLARAGQDLTWLGAANSWSALQELLTRATPDIVLVDLHLGDGSDSAEVIRHLAAEGIRCVILTSELRPVPVRRAVAAGAVGLMLKSDPVESMAATLDALRTTPFAVSSDLAHVILTDPAACALLTGREQEILVLLAEGYTRESIARRTTDGITEATVSSHLNRAKRRYTALGRPVSSSIELLREALADGYLQGEQR